MSLLANIHIQEKIEEQFGERCWSSFGTGERTDGLYDAEAELKDGRIVKGVFRFTGADVEAVEPLAVVGPATCYGCGKSHKAMPEFCSTCGSLQLYLPDQPAAPADKAVFYTPVKEVGRLQVNVEHTIDGELTTYRVCTTERGLVQHWSGTFKDAEVAGRVAQYVAIVLEGIKAERLKRRLAFGSFVMHGDTLGNYRFYAAVNVVASSMNLETEILRTLGDLVEFTVPEPLAQLLELLIERGIE